MAAYLLSYLSPIAEAPRMENLPPFHGYIGAEPLATGSDRPGLALLAALAVLAALGGAASSTRRDLMVRLLVRHTAAADPGGSRYDRREGLRTRGS